VYSLVSPADLATALVRHRTANEVVDVIDRALRIDRTQLAELSVAHSDDTERQLAWARVCELAGIAAHTLATHTDDDRVSALPRRLGGTDTVDGAEIHESTDAGLDFSLLLDFLREEVLGWTREQVGDLVVQSDPDGVAAVTDALAAAWAGTDAPPADRDRLTAPWLEVFGELPAVSAADAYGVHSAAVRQLLDTLSSADADVLAQLGEGYRLQAPPRPSGVRPWDIAMRRACQATFVTGRVREVAAAQLAAVRAQLLPGVPAGLPGTSLGDAVAQAIAGTVQAVCMRDTLERVVFRFLVLAWVARVGPIPE
jgi:hypothetical protein